MDKKSNIDYTLPQPAAANACDRLISSLSPSIIWMNFQKPPSEVHLQWRGEHRKKPERTESIKSINIMDGRSWPAYVKLSGFITDTWIDGFFAKTAFQSHRYIEKEAYWVVKCAIMTNLWKFSPTERAKRASMNVNRGFDTPHKSDVNRSPFFQSIPFFAPLSFFATFCEKSARDAMHVHRFCPSLITIWRILLHPSIHLSNRGSIWSSSSNRSSDMICKRLR